MKINNLGPHISKLYQKIKVQETAKQAEVQQEQDSLTISGQAVKLQEMVKKVGKISEVRNGLVDKLRAEISQGTYRPDSREIAKSMLKKQD